MATLSTQSFQNLVRNMVAAVQGASTTLVNLNVGSVLLAILQSIAGVVLWLQGLAVYILTLTRAATSQNGDLDSWMADYDFPREEAVTATGQATFSRFTATSQAVIPFGATIQTGDGTQVFTVDTDSTNAAYNLALGGYVLPAGTPSLNVNITASTPGSAGNVIAGSITSINRGIPYIDTVTNAAALVDGEDAEEDPAYRARFVLYIASLSKAVNAAIESAIENVQQGLNYTITSNQAYADGSTKPGFFYVVVSDGLGYPSSDLLASVGNAIDAVRGLTITFAVFAPIVIVATPTLVITTDPSYTHATVIGFVGVAVQNYINSLTIGTSLPLTKLAAVAYGVAGVTNVSGLLINGSGADIAASPKQTIRSGNPVVS